MVISYLCKKKEVIGLHICGSFTSNQKKPCKNCKHFFLWGVSTGYCGKHNKDVSCKEHCKYFKREREVWAKNGKCKVDVFSLYL